MKIAQDICKNGYSFVFHIVINTHCCAYLQTANSQTNKCFFTRSAYLIGCFQYLEYQATVILRALRIRTQHGGGNDATRFLWRFGFTKTGPFGETSPSAWIASTRPVNLAKVNLDSHFWCQRLNFDTLRASPLVSQAEIIREQQIQV